MVDIQELAKKAQARKVIYPQLEFTPQGDKYAEGEALVLFKDIGFAVVNNPKAKGDMPKEFLAIHVDLLDDSDFGQSPGTYQLLTAATNSSLTDGILKLFKENNDNLQGVAARIETYNYVHPKHGKTRGYRVTRVKSSS